MAHDANGNTIGKFIAGADDSSEIVGEPLGYGLVEVNAFMADISGVFDRYALESIDVDPQVGQQVCKLGARTGLTCGEISELGANYFLVDGMQVDHGDSGGIVFRVLPNGRAAFVGMVSGFLDSRHETAVAQLAGDLMGQLNAFAAGRGDTFHFKSGV